MDLEESIDNFKESIKSLTKDKVEMCQYEVRSANLRSDS